MNPAAYRDAIVATNKRYWVGQISQAEWLAEIDGLEADHHAEMRALEADHADVDRPY